jgi:hypothetical protein
MNPTTHHPAAHARQYRYYDFPDGRLRDCIVLCANLIGAAKKSTVHLPVHLAA